jgi:hypothetical protein
MILVSITIFSTVLGVRYLKEALLDAISILNFGTVVSEYRPLQNPTVKNLQLFSHCLNSRHTLQELFLRIFERGSVLNFKSYSDPFLPFE